MAKCNRIVMFLTMLFLAQPYPGLGYISPSLTSSTSGLSGSLSSPDHYLPDAFLRELIDRMSKDLVDPSEAYLDSLVDIAPPSHLSLISRTPKDLESEQFDYDALLDGAPHPSLRDQEYVQHSSLWGHQYVSGGGGEIPNTPKHQVKTDASLPAYCNPPNPCPFGVEEDQGCLMQFENTAAFSRQYQAAQECMCDGEHMFDCSENQDQNEENEDMTSDLESFLAQQYQSGNTKNMLAKKADLGEQDEEINPFLQGEKLPIAAKKGINVY